MATNAEVRGNAGKVLQVRRADTADPWLTLPGGTGEMSREAASIDDTIYGNPYSSQEVGLIGWTLTGNALFKGFAGYKAELRRASGGSIAMPARQALTRTGTTSAVWYTEITEAGSQPDPAPARTVIAETAAAEEGVNKSALFSTYYSPNGRDVWDSATTMMFETYNSGSPSTGAPLMAADIKSINYLHGEVELTQADLTRLSGTARTGHDAVRIASGGKFFIMQNLANAMSFTLGQTVNAVENTTFPGAQINDGFRTFQYGLKEVTLEVGGIYRSTPDWVQALIDRETLLIDISPDGEGKSSFRGYFNLMTQSQSGDVGALEEESLSFRLQVPSSNYVPISWVHAGDTTLHESVRIILDAFEENKAIDLRYLHNGTNGFTGCGIITDCGLESGLEAMNTFNATFQGTGPLTTVTV